MKWLFKKPKPVIVVYVPLEFTSTDKTIFLKCNIKLAEDYHLVFIGGMFEGITLKLVQ